MERRAAEFRVGLLTIVSVGVFLALFGIVSGAALRKPSERYTVRFGENVKGMAVGSAVNFHGIPVGAVTDMRFAGGATLVEIEVDPARTEMTDSLRARIDRALVTGQVTVELEGYAADGMPLPVGAEIASVASPIDALAGSLPEMLHSIGGTFDRVREVLDDARLARVDAVLVASERAAAALPDAVRRVADEAVATLAELRATSRATRESLGRFDARLAALGGDVGAVRAGAARTLAAVADSVQATERRLAATLDAVTGLASGVKPPALRALGEIRDALRAVRVLAERLGTAPSSLVWGSRQDEIVVPAATGREPR